MLASGVQLLACGMAYTHFSDAKPLNPAKYIIMTDVTAKLHLEQSHQQ